MATAVYPGSFDPLTSGHLDVISRSAKMFDRLIVGVLTNSIKSCSFSADERVKFINKAAGHIQNVRAEQFSGLLVDFVKKKEASVIVKGLRAISDFESEFQMALVNKNQLPEVETIFIPTSTEYMFLSSSVVKELARYNGKLDGLVPNEIQSDLYKKLGRVEK